MDQETKLTKEKLISLYEGSNHFLSPKNIRDKSLRYLKTKARFPFRKDEAWKHTNLDSLLRHNYIPGESIIDNLSVSKEVASNFHIPKLETIKLVFINGVFSNELSDHLTSDGKIIISDISEAKEKYPELFGNLYGKHNLSEHDIFTATNTAFSKDGAFIYLDDNQQIDKPVHVIHISDNLGKGTMSHMRNLVYAGDNSYVKIIESYHSVSTLTTFTNVATEVYLRRKANVDYNIFQGESDNGFQINNLRVEQHKDSVFSSNTITLCGSLVRNELFVDHKEIDCQTNLHGLYLADKHQHFDNHIFVNHAKPHCESNQLYRGIVDNQASAVFLGRIYVARDAQKTQAYQSNSNILLTDDAKVASKPQLEIYADDVKCSHGSTTGQIDKEALFYLRSRGINPEKAKIILLNAFAVQVLEKITIEPLKDMIEFLVEKRLKGEKVKNQCMKIFL